MTRSTIVFSGGVPSPFRNRFLQRSRYRLKISSAYRRTRRENPKTTTGRRAPWTTGTLSFMEADQDRTAVIFVGGDPVDASISLPVPPNALLIAADSGLHQAILLGLQVDVVVGDMDSVEPSALEATVALGARVERHPTDKDATDLELALDYSARAGCNRIVVIGATGGRLDHFLANALLLAAGPHGDIEIEWWAGAAHVSVVRPDRPLHYETSMGDVISLIAVGGTAGGVRTKGLRWALTGRTLEPGSTLGVSNEATDSAVAVSIESGVLLVVRHGVEDT